MAEPISTFVAYLTTVIGGAISLIPGVSASTAFFIADLGIKLAALSALDTVVNALVPFDGSTPATTFTVTIRGTIEHQRIIYGETLASGPMQYLNTAGSHNQSLHTSIVLAGHEIEDITDMWIDDTRIPNDYINWAPGDNSVNSGPFRGNTSADPCVYFYKHVGSADQSADAALVAAFTEIGSSHQGKQVAYFVSRFDYFKGQTDVWSSGIPSNIRALVKGKKVYDPRSDTTQSFGTGPHRVDSSPTWAYSNNPALCWADYMIDSRLGFNESASRINYGYVASAAEICDTVVFTPVGTDKKFTCNGVLSTGDTYKENIRRILSSMNGSLAQQNGMWLVRAWGYTTPTLSFSDDDLRDDLQIRLSPNEKERYNTVRGTFINKDNQWKAGEFPPFTSSEYVSRDNDRVLNRDIQLSMTKDLYMAQRIAAGILEQSDLEKTIVLPTNYKTLPVEIGGTLQYTNTKMGWTDKVFKVQRYAYKERGGIDIVAREDESTAYTPITTAEYSVASAGGYTTANPGVPAPSSLWAEARPDGNQIYWTPPAARLYEYVKLFVSPTSAWTDAVEVEESRTDNFFHKYVKPVQYYYWAKSVNYVGEESDKIPNSDYSNVFAFPGLIGGRPDSTFDLSENITDFFEVSGNSAWISTTEGENSEHALRFAVLHSNGDASIRRKQFNTLDSNTVKIATRYRINSWFGTAAGSQWLELRARGAFPTPVASTFDKFQQTDPSTYTNGVTVKAQYFSNSINTTGSWFNISAELDLSNIIGSGNTMVRFGLAWVESGPVSLDARTNAVHNNFTFIWV